MTSHLARAIEALKRELLSLSAKVEEIVHLAVKAALGRDAALGVRVLAMDDEIDRREVEIEEECLKILALHQPVAIDLRFIIAVLKINNDLERIADLGSNIAGRAESLSQIEPNQYFGLISSMSTRVEKMLGRSLKALVEMDPELARLVWQDDAEVDKVHREMYQFTRTEIERDPRQADIMMQLLSISRNLERIADLATNVAEDVVYMTEGEIVRHRKKPAR